MERPKLGYCQRIDLAPNVLLVDTAKLHELIEWSVWAEQELSKLHQPTVISAVCEHSWMNSGMSVQGKSLIICTKCRETKQTDL